MYKVIHIENSSNNVVRVLSIADESIMENNPTGLEYILIDDYVDPPTLDNPLSINYPMYYKLNKTFKWVQIQYQNTATEEMLQIENLKLFNSNLQNELDTANENINLLIELQADTLGGAI